MRLLPPRPIDRRVAAGAFALNACMAALFFATWPPFLRWTYVAMNLFLAWNSWSAARVVERAKEGQEPPASGGPT